MDTAAVLQIRAGLALIEQDLTAARGHLAELARKYRDTPMAGRTHLQHALPVTFGYKAAVWLYALDRHADRLRELRPRVLLVQFGGAAGTLASLGNGERSLDARAELARELGLGDPPITWHVVRDGIAETVQVLALLAGSLGKIAFDVMLMSATEFGEAAEPFIEGRGSSSTMPQKRNPISCELILAATKVLRQQAGLALDAVVTDFERATGPWHVEWVALPEAFGFAAGALHQARFMLGGLIVDPARMAKNLAMTHGLIVAEAVMMGLAPHTGRNEAHDLVYDACRIAIETDRPLLEVLLETPAVAGPLGPEKLRCVDRPRELSRRRPGDGRPNAGPAGGQQEGVTEPISPIANWRKAEAPIGLAGHVALTFCRNSSSDCSCHIAANRLSARRWLTLRLLKQRNGSMRPWSGCSPPSGGCATASCSCSRSRWRPASLPASG